MSQKKFANMLNISVRTYTKWEHGEIVPDLENIVYMSNHLNIRVDWFLCGKTDFSLYNLNEQQIKKIIKVLHEKE